MSIVDSLSSLLQQHSEDDSTRVNLLNGISHALYRADRSRALKYAKEANDLSIQINYLKGKAQSFNLMGIYHSSHDESLKYHKNALEAFKKLNDKKGMNKSYMNIGISYRRKGNYPKALEYYHNSLKISEELYKRKALENSAILSGCYNSIGIIHLHQDNFAKALEYYQKSLKICKEFNDRLGELNCLNNIGVVYDRQGDSNTALEYYEKVLNIYLKEEPSFKERIASSYYNVGLIYMRKGEHSKAYKYYQQALIFAEEIGNKSITAYAYQGMSKLAIAQNNVGEAFNYSKKAYNLAKDGGELEQLKEIAQTLAETSNALGNYKDAFDYYVLYKAMNDSIFNESNIKEITALEYQYKFDKEKRESELIQQKKDAVRIEQAQKQRILLIASISGLVLMSLLVLIVLRSLMQKRETNEALATQQEQISERNSELVNMNQKIRAQSTELTYINQKLSELNITKDKFFSIISHDLKSPFNAVLGFSSLLLEKHDKIDDKERAKIIKYVNSSAESAYKLLENLLAWSQAQSGKLKYSPETLDIKDLSIETIFSLEGQAREKGITIINETSGTAAVYADKNMLSMVLRNLISNAVKFTHKGGEVRINIQRCEEDILVSVLDTGVGISNETLTKLFSISENTSTLGTNNEKGTGLGLILCKEFVEKHGGNIWVESEVGKGTIFYFTIPAS